MKDLARKSVELPDDFECHSRLKRMHIASRLKDIENGNSSNEVYDKVLQALKYVKFED